MQIWLKRDGRYIGVNPHSRSTVYADRTKADEWEEIELTRHDDGLYDARFVAANVQLSIQPNGSLETRPAGVFGPWELFTVSDAPGVAMTLGRADVALQLTIEGTLLVPAKPQPAPVPSRWHATGRGFVDANEQPVDWAMTAGNRDLDRLLRGQRDDLRAVLTQAQALGSTGRRVFACKTNWAVFDGSWHDGPDRTWPVDHADYFDRVAELADLHASFNQQLNLVAFTGTSTSRRQMLGDEGTFWNRLVEIAHAKENVILSLGNELDAHDQGINIAAFQQPEGVLCSSGSNGGGSNPPEPFWRGRWGYCELHPERNQNRPSLGTTTLFFARHGYAGEGNNPGFAGTQWDTVASEPLGFNEDDEPGRRTNDPDVAYLLGLGCAWGAGGTTLSTDGIESIMLRSRQAECTRQFLRGVKRQ